MITLPDASLASTLRGVLQRVKGDPEGNETKLPVRDYSCDIPVDIPDIKLGYSIRDKLTPQFDALTTPGGVFIGDEESLSRSIYEDGLASEEAQTLMKIRSKPPCIEK